MVDDGKEGAEGGGQAGRRQEDRRKEENVGGMAESRREKKSASLSGVGGGRKNTAREGLVARRAERAIGRANARAFGKMLHGEGG